MNVCVLATSYPRHAQDHASVFVHGLCRHLAARGVHIKAIVPHELGLADQALLEGVLLRRFHYFWPSRFEQLAYGFGIPDNLRRKFWAKINLPFFIACFFVKAWRESRHADLLHAHWEISALVAVVIARFRRVPVVYTVHRLVARGWLMKMLTRFLLRRVSALHFNSSYTRDQAQALLGAQLPGQQIVYPSVEPQAFEHAEGEGQQVRTRFGIPKGARVILGLGRLVEKKGFCYLIEAFRKLQQEFPETFLLIAGGGPLYEALHAQCARDLKAGTFSFTGFVSPRQIAALLHEATLMAVPSIEDSHGEIETLGVVSIEALAAGLPVVAARTGGIGDVIEDGKTGLLVAPRDAQALMQAMVKILGDDWQRQRLITEGKLAVQERFSWHRATEQTLLAYQALVVQNV